MGAQESSERGRVPSSWLQSLNGKRSTTLKSAIEAARTDTWNRDAELVFCTQEYFASKVLGLKINTSASISSPGTTMTCRSSGNDLHNLGKKGTAVLFCVLDLSNTDHDEEAQAAVAGGLSAGEASTKIAEKYRSNVFIFRVVSPGQTQHQGHQEGTTNSNSRHGNGEANNAISTGPQPLPFGEIVFQKERTSKSGNIALLHDCGYQTYAQRLEFAEQVADLNFDTQSAYDKVQRALKYLTKPGVLQSGKSLLKTCQPPVDLETPMLRPMNPGEDFVLKDGKVFLVVYSRQKPTYYDLSLAGSEKRLNLTYSRTRFSGSLALGSGDQLGSENVPGGTTCPMLVHEFEFRPECLPFPPCGAEEESQGIGCVLFSGYQSTKLKAWSRDRPIVMLMHVDSDGLNTCYYCPAPMNDRIGESITYGAISFQVVRNTGGGSTSLGQLLFEGKMRKKKKLKMSLSGLKSRFAEKENEIDAADENKEEPAASDEGESQDEEQWTHKLRFYLHTAQEGYCPRGLDKSAPVSAACYKHYFETAEAYFATAPSLREIERRAAAAGEADGDSATGGASSSGTAQDRQGAPAAGSRISTSTGKVDQQNADVKIDPFAHVPGPVVVSNSVGAAKTLAQLFDPEEHGGEQQKTSSTGSAKGKKSLTEVSIFIEFANGFRKMPSSAGASSNTTTKAFLGQLTAAKHSKQPVLLMMGEIEEGPLTKWSPTKNPTLLLIDDANRIPYEAMSFVDGPKRAFEDCLCVIYTRADLKLTNGDVQAAAEAAIGQIDMNPFFLLGQKCVVLAVVVNKADETQVTAVRVLRKGPSCCGSTLIDEVFQHVPEGVTYFGPAASGKNSKEGSSVLSNKAKASQSKNKVVANLKLQEMSRHSAVCLIPPGAQPQLASFYAKVEAVRRDHDKAYHKWMPHVNLLFPFVKGFEANDATDGMKESPLLKSLQAACKKLSPFKIRFSRVGKFSQKGSATLHLVPEYVVQSTSSSLSKGGEENTTDFDDPMEGTPSCSSQGSFSQLIDAIEQALMDCGADKIVADQPRTGERGTADYFHPHLTLGQCASADADTRMQQFSTKIFGDADPTSPAFAPVEFVVDRLHIVGRPDGQAKMSVREEIGLGTGELLFATSPEVVNEDNINGTGTTGTNITVAKMLSNVRDWAFRGLLSDEGDFCGTTRTSSAAFAPPSRGSASTSVTSTAGPFVDCVGKILIPPGDYVPFSELAAFVDKSLFKPLLLQGLETEMKPKLAELTAAFHEENRINDMAAGIGELQLGTANNGTTSTSAGAPSTDEPQPVEDHSAPREVELATLRKQREQALLLRKHNAFEQELGKRLEGTVGPHLKSLLSHLEWVAFEGQVSSCRKSLASLWNEQIVPEILSLHATLVLTTEDETPLASSGGGDSAAAPLLSATSSAEGDVPMSIRTVPSTESASTAQKENTDRASPAISALTRAWQNGDLEAVRVAQQLKQMSAKIKRKCVYLARFFDLSSKRKNNATYAMIVELAAKNKRGARAQQKADTTKTNLSTLKNMSRDDFFDYYSQPEVCQTILHAVIDTLDSKTTFEHQVLAICGPNQDFLRTKPDAKLLRAVENRIAQRENKMKTISPAGSEQEPLQRQKNQTQGTSSGAFTGAATSAAASPTTSISPAICGVSNRMLTFEADVYSDIAAIPEATANIALNEQQGGGEKHAKTTLCYRPVQNTAPVIPIPIFARYAVQEGGEAEEIFMRKQTYIPWDEETAKPDVQMWRMAVAKVIQNSSSLQRVVTTQTGGGGELTIQNAQWVLVKILLDLSLVLHDRLRNVASLTPANRFDSVPSMLRSLVLTAIGITQAGDKPLGNAWSVCKNVPTRPELPEDKRDWYLLLVLATVFPKTGLDASCFRANLRRQLVRFFNKMCEPYIQELWKDYDARKKQYDADIASNYILQPIPRKELKTVMVMRPSKFCAICWLLKPPHHFPKSASSGRHVNRFEKHSKTAEPFTFPSTLEDFKTEFDVRMQVPKTNKLTGETKPTGKTLLELYTSTDTVTNKRSVKRLTSEALRAVILSGKQNQKKTSGSIAQELNNPPDFETFCARVRNEVCGTTGYTCVECLFRLKFIGKTHVNAGGYMKKPKDPNYVVPLPDPIEPLPGLAPGVVEAHNAEVAKVRAAAEKKKAQFLDLCKKAYGARLAKEGAAYQDYKGAAKKMEQAANSDFFTEQVEQFDESGEPWSRMKGVDRAVAPPKSLLLAKTGSAALMLNYSQQNKRQRDANELDDLEVVGSNNTLLEELFEPDGEGSCSSSTPRKKAKKAAASAENAASASPSVDERESTFKRTLNQLTELFGCGGSDSVSADVTTSKEVFLAAAVTSSKASKQNAEHITSFATSDVVHERFASVWACSLVGNETAALAAVCAAYRGPDFDVLAELLRASGLVGDKEDVSIAIRTLLRELVLDYKCKDMVARENNYLAKFYRDEGKKE